MTHGDGYLLIHADAGAGIPLKDNSIDACVCSPPFFGLRQYQGVEPTDWPEIVYRPMAELSPVVVPPMTCCLGNEPDVTSYVGHLVWIFRDVYRVLHDSGSLILNLGDSYSSGGCKTRTLPGGNLFGVPWRVAFALQAPWETGRVIKHDVHRAWLAALVDGEGCIGIRRYVSRSNGSGNPRCQDGFVPFICISNNDRELLDRCVEITGGCGRVAIKSRPSTDNRGIRSRRDNYGWRLDANKAVKVIREIYPFLIAKRRQAVLAESLYQSNKIGRSLRGNGRLPESEQEKREALKLLINRCNQREPVDIPSWCVEPRYKPEFEPGWLLRSAPPWIKPDNAMPESVQSRPGTAHEMIFILAKSNRYYWDADTVRRSFRKSTLELDPSKFYSNRPGYSGNPNVMGEKGHPLPGNPNGRGWRTADIFMDALDEAIAFHRGRADELQAARDRGGMIVGGDDDGEAAAILANPQSFKGAHFATWSGKLISPFIRAATSEHGCCSACGRGWRRVVERETTGINPDRPVRGLPYGVMDQRRRAGDSRSTTLGWSSACSCSAPARPAVVLDPFAGSGSTLVAALALGRSAIGIDASAEYLGMARRRLERPHAAVSAPAAKSAAPLPLFPEDDS